MELLKHILERGGLHIVAAAFVYLCVHFSVRYAARKWRYWGLALPAILTVAAMGWHEVYDLATDANPPIKSLTDGISWLIGTGLTAWALYRFRNEH